MNLAILLLLFFPSAIVGKPAELSGSYHSSSWDFVGANCASMCNNHEDGYMCSRSSQSFLHCNCWGCTRGCRLSEAAVSLNHCASAQKKIEELEVDVAGHLADLSAQLAIDLISNVPVVGGVASAALNFGKGMFDIGEKETLLNGAIRDMNSRMDAMSKCVGQMIDESEVRDVAGEIKIAFWRYDNAIGFDGDASKKMEQFEDAWAAHVDVMESKLYILNKPKEYFVKLLMQVQDFAQSFALVSFDYLTYLHELDEVNYKDDFERTIDAFGQLRTWADKARSVILSSLSKQMRSKPCNNGASLDNEMIKWNTAFKKMNINPIEAYMVELIKMNRVLVSKNGWFKGDIGSTCDKTCQSMGMLCDADKQSTITSQSAIKNAFSDAGYGCKSVGMRGGHRAYAGAPFSTGRSSDDCFYLTPGAKSVCNANAYAHYPLCSCKPAVRGWYRGTAGATCDKTCQRKGLTCDANKQSTITSQSAIKNAFSDAGYVCKSVGKRGGHRAYAGAPFSTGRSSDDCFYISPGAKSVCNANANPGHSALCYCK